MSNFKFDAAAFQEMQGKTKEALEKLQKAKADYFGETPELDVKCFIEKTCSYVDSLNYTIDSLSRQLSYLSDSFYNHLSNGHLPPAPGPAGMASAIEALGWGEDFEVKPRQIYASLKEGSIKFNGQEIKI